MRCRYVSIPALASFLHHHHKAAGIAAGLAANHMAKSHGHGFLARHHKAVGIVTGLAVNHMGKKHH